MTNDPSQISMLALRDAPDFSGPLLRSDGRLAILNRGRGFCIRLTPAELREFARKALVTAALLEDREAAAADAAGEALAKVVAGNG